MRIIKRNGTEVEFDSSKIAKAITKANESVPEAERMKASTVHLITHAVTEECRMLGRAVGVEEIQDMVENHIMEQNAFNVARNYITYRYNRSLVRKSNTTDESILALIDLANEEVKQENSNKNPILNSTQRDYIAGEVSKDISRRLLLPQDVVEAHDKGIIHFHDMDYFVQHMHNCCLVNLEDMLQNGTVITDTMITKPHSFHTACNIATQVIAQIASNQYGGQTFTLAHLAPFVDVSRRKFQKQAREELLENTGLDGEALETAVNNIAESRLEKEIDAGMQLIQYQLLTLMTTNGQTPFVTMYMYLDEVPEGKLRDDLALCIKVALKQRIKGVQDKSGAWVAPSFPKIIYVLDEDNIHPDSPYYDLTVLAAECTAKRMVPDYISAKIMKELKGDVYGCMGCRSFLTPDTVGLNPDGSHKYYGRLTA